MVVAICSVAEVIAHVGGILLVTDGVGDARYKGATLRWRTPKTRETSYDCPLNRHLWAWRTVDRRIVCTEEARVDGLRTVRQGESEDLARIDSKPISSVWWHAHRGQRLKVAAISDQVHVELLIEWIAAVWLSGAGHL